MNQLGGFKGEREREREREYNKKLITTSYNKLLQVANYYSMYAKCFSYNTIDVGWFLVFGGIKL